MVVKAVEIFEDFTNNINRIEEDLQKIGLKMNRAKTKVAMNVDNASQLMQATGK